jgi:hypothetical protein
MSTDYAELRYIEAQLEAAKRDQSGLLPYDAAALLRRKRQLDRLILDYIGRVRFPPDCA